MAISLSLITLAASFFAFNNLHNEAPSGSYDHNEAHHDHVELGLLYFLIEIVLLRDSFYLEFMFDN